MKRSAFCFLLSPFLFSRVFVAMLLAASASCNLLTPLAFVGQHQRVVPPEFDKLPSSRVVVLVWTDPSTLFDYPHAQFEVASYVGEKLQTELATRKFNTQWVDARDVVDYVQRNRAARIDPEAVGRHFDADYVIYIEVVRFQMREPEQPQFLRGRLDASVAVHDVRADTDQLRRYELAPVQCVHPEGGPVPLTATNAALLREATYRAFAERVARKFYEHKIEL